MRFISFFIASVLFLSLAILCSSCEKEYSYEGGITGTAVFTYLDDNGNCTSPVINGTYAAGIKLQPANTIQLLVNVTSTGSFALSTNVTNGMQFTATGNFTSLGIQYITLTGIGKPLATGTFSFTPLFGTGCTFMVTVGNTSSSNAIFTLQGDPGNCSNITINGTYTSGTALNITNTIDVMVNVSSIGSYVISTTQIDGISFSASGNFTTTGIQKVILQGSGTPATPDNLQFNLTGGASICSFDLTILTPGPPATYVLESNPDGSCTGYTVSGNFYKGEALTITENIAVKVTVTVLGNFTISTNTVNGITFSHTGSFIALGSQIVILTGTGTPVNSGTFTFTPQIIGPHPIGGATCTANVVVL